MQPLLELSTDRLVLRRWREDDLPPFAALNSDPEVMEFMPKLLSREESDALASRIREHFEQHGFGLWALETRDGGEFLGFTGLSTPRFTARFTPCIEVGWRLKRAAWGHGYATEAARAALCFGFERLGLASIVSFTVPANVRSWRVMERLGMIRDPAEDFAHPLLPEGHPLQRHILYRARPGETNGVGSRFSLPSIGG